MFAEGFLVISDAVANKHAGMKGQHDRHIAEQQMQVAEREEQQRQVNVCAEEAQRAAAVASEAERYRAPFVFLFCFRSVHEMCVS